MIQARIFKFDTQVRLRKQQCIKINTQLSGFGSFAQYFRGEGRAGNKSIPFVRDN